MKERKKMLLLFEYPDGEVKEHTVYKGHHLYREFSKPGVRAFVSNGVRVTRAGFGS